MKTSLVRVCLLAAVLIFLSACGGATPNKLSVDKDDSGSTVNLAAGGTLTVTLPSNASTGFRWSENAAISDATVIQQTSHKYVEPEKVLPGAGGTEVWTFQAAKAGQSKISMEYRRVGEQPMEKIPGSGVMVTPSAQDLFDITITVK